MRNAGAREHVARRREAVALVRHRIDGVALRLERFDRLPDRVAGNAEGKRDFLTGEVNVLIRFEKGLQVVLNGHKKSPPKVRL
ncbi:hypothetical protein SDC9_95732 [bioreactor metagenome]|uniref:Uncharacterized protein n=1 Tax=bioreactor metagenome TaxID=1076179 RepID=A0A645AH80_9ZZZZ